MTGNVSTNGQRKLAIFYEHSEWFKPLFAELDRRGIGYDEQVAYEHHFNAAERESPYALTVNRMSPSAHTRGHGHAMFYTLQYLAYLKAINANVLNGYDAFAYELSKAAQLNLLERLGLPYPKARVINHPSQAVAAADGLIYPIVVKPNIGGSGAGIVQFNTPEELRAGVADGIVDLGLDQTALVQEFLPARGNSVVRVEVMNGEFLYAIRLHLTDTFNLCPADYCDPETGEVASSGKPLVEGYTPPREVIDNVIRITEAAHMDLGGVEYLVNDRDGGIYYYDVNALSNFVADASNVVGFDPFPNLVDFLLVRSGHAARKQFAH